MTSKFSENKKLIWIGKEVHSRLRWEAFKMNATIGTLADLAINHYLDLLTRKGEEER